VYNVVRFPWIHPFLFFSFCFTIVHVHISYHINLLSSILLVIFIYRICLRVFCVFSVRLLVCSICNCYFDLIFLQMPRSLTNEQRIFLVKQWWISGNTRVACRYLSLFISIKNYDMYFTIQRRTKSKCVFFLDRLLFFIIQFFSCKKSKFFFDEVLSNT
jgi:hypothetical protein